MNNQEIYAKGFSKGWEECRHNICKIYQFDELLMIKLEEIDNFSPTTKELEIIKHKKVFGDWGK